MVAGKFQLDLGEYGAALRQLHQLAERGMANNKAFRMTCQQLLDGFQGQAADAFTGRAGEIQQVTDRNHQAYTKILGVLGRGQSMVEEQENTGQRLFGSGGLGAAGAGNFMQQGIV